MTPQDAIIARQYDRWAGVYDVLWRRYVNQTVPIARRAADVRSGERVLDLACGTGVLSRAIVENTPDVEVVGIDLSSSMIVQAQNKNDGGEDVQFQRGNAHDLPLQDNAFDVVVCASSFHYFTQPRRVLEEIGRVLQPEGRFVVLDWCRDFLICRLMDGLLRWMDPAYHGCYTLDELLALIDRAGLESTRRFRYRFDLVWGMMVVRAVPTASK